MKRECGSAFCVGLIQMPGDVDWLAIIGLAIVAAGLWLQFGPGAALIFAGAVLVVVSVGVAITGRTNGRTD